MNDISTIRDFFDYLNVNCDYLVLRNWDDIFDEGIYGSGHEDIDILCRDLQSFIDLTGAKRIHNSSYRDNFVVSIGNLKVRFDVRHVGDGYYPAMWEAKMLDNKVETEQHIYIMNTEDYVYSLSYHALIQKPSLSQEYIKKVLDAFHILEGHDIEMKDYDILKMLQSYCARNNYVLEIPNDPGVYLNKKNMANFVTVQDLSRSRRRAKLRVTQTFNYYVSRIISKILCQK